MTKQNMIELVKQHHPHMGQIEIQKLLDRAKDLFCLDTEVIEDSFYLTTAVDQRHYTLDNKIIKVKSATFDGVAIPRLVGNIPIEDTTGTEE
jgi:hypothetical protein